MQRVKSLIEWEVLNKLDHGWTLMGWCMFPPYGPRLYKLSTPDGTKSREVSPKIVDRLYIAGFIVPWLLSDNPTVLDLSELKLTSYGRKAYLAY